MPTNQNAYNTRLTDEALEKRFRDTFKSQSGAELVDDLYASGVIIPVVDFTAAAEGSFLREDLQTAWDYSTNLNTISNASTTLTITPGFWKMDLNLAYNSDATRQGLIKISDGLSFKLVWKFSNDSIATPADNDVVVQDSFIIYVRSGDTVTGEASGGVQMNVWYRPIADVYGNFIQPNGFTSS